jgi:hypothetical protein
VDHNALSISRYPFLAHLNQFYLTIPSNRHAIIPLKQYPPISRPFRYESTSTSRLCSQVPIKGHNILISKDNSNDCDERDFVKKALRNQDVKIALLEKDMKMEIQGLRHDVQNMGTNFQMLFHEAEKRFESRLSNWLFCFSMVVRLSTFDCSLFQG